MQGFNFELEWQDEFLTDKESLTTGFLQGGSTRPRVQMLCFQIQASPTNLEKAANDRANKELQDWLSKYNVLVDPGPALQALCKSVAVIVNRLPDEDAYMARSAWAQNIVSQITVTSSSGTDLGRTQDQRVPQSQDLMMPAREDFPLKMKWVPPIDLLPAFIELQAKPAAIDLTKFRAVVPLVEGTFDTTGTKFEMKVKNAQAWPSPADFPFQLQVLLWSKTSTESAEDIGKGQEPLRAKAARQPGFA